MQSINESRTSVKNIVSSKDKTQDQSFMVKIPKIVFWWHYAWLVVIISVVVYNLGLTSLTRLATLVMLMIIAAFSHKAYQTLYHGWTTAAFITLTIGVFGAIYLDKLTQVLATGLIVIIIFCISLIILGFAIMIRSLSTKDPTSTP